jgi:hypothetical protein
MSYSDIEPGIYEALGTLGNGVGPAFNSTLVFVDDVFVITHVYYTSLVHIRHFDVLTCRGFGRVTTTLDAFRRNVKRIM